MKDAIGGDFSYPISHLCRGPFDAFKAKPIYSSGRSALSLIIKSIMTFEGKDYTVLSPSYSCESLQQTYRDLDVPFKLYPITKNLRINRAKLTALDRNSKYIFILISYFGMVKVDEDIEWIKQEFPKSIVINDLVQDLWSFLEKENKADYCFSSLRKALASPDGALIRTNGKALLPVKKSISFSRKRILAATLKYSGLVRDDIFLKYFNEAEAMFSSEPSYCSIFTKNILSHTDLLRAKEKRKENSQHAVYYAKKHGLKLLFELGKNDVALCIPILLEKRDLVKSYLIKNGVYLPVHWPLEADSDDPIARKISEEIISIVVDQRYDKKDIEIQIDQILRGISHANITDSRKLG